MEERSRTSAPQEAQTGAAPEQRPAGDWTGGTSPA